MMKNINKITWLERLERIRYEEKEDLEEGSLEQMSLASSILALAEINHEREYDICRSLAQHLLGKVPEPDDADLEED
jgi:hypothetical protein